MVTMVRLILTLCLWKEIRGKRRKIAPPNSSSESWRGLLNRLRNGPSEPGDSLVTSDADNNKDDGNNNNSEDNDSDDSDDNDDDDDDDNNSEGDNNKDNNSEGNQSPERLEDSVQHSYLDLNFSPLDSPRVSNSRSPNPPMSAEQDAQSQKQASFPSAFETGSPAASTRSKLSQRVHESKSTSQIPASQASEVIDLTSSPRESPEPSISNSNPSQRSKSAVYGKSQRDEDIPHPSGRPPRASTGRLQHLVEVSISPSSQKKRRSSRKFWDMLYG
jgi:hypothetical protein